MKSIRENCALFGIFGAKKAAELTYLGLYAMQHRGQEASGIVSSDGTKTYAHKGIGLVDEVYQEKESLNRLKGNRAIGHNRYSTTGSSSDLDNVQPFAINYKDGDLAIAHNGNLTNAVSLRRSMEKKGSIFQSSSDTEVILHLIATSRQKTLENRIIDALRKVEGAYSLLLITKDKVIAARDPRGWRPLALGRLKGAWVVASETCAFDLIGAKYIRDIQPGEIFVMSEKKNASLNPFAKRRSAHCVFEFIYFARPDSKIFGQNVDKVRRRLGRELATEHPADADIVISVPDSSNTHTLGYSEKSGIRQEIGLIRNHYVGRTFIAPEQKIRDLDAKIKYNPVKGVLNNRKVVIVDDSIVRGTTSRKLVQMVKRAGAKEIHFRVASPPIVAPCFYGIDMPTKKELIASSKSVEKIRRYLGVKSLGYLSLKGMMSMKSLGKNGYCTSCFTGKYPTKIENHTGKHALERK